MHQIIREDSEDLGFAVSCLWCAISQEEFDQWLYMLIESYPAEYLPTYIFELATEKYFLKDIYKIIGFVPDSNLTQKQQKALYGIAIKRDYSLGDINYKEETVLKALNDCPEVMERFKKAFPFIAAF
ncbi:hypothetical protein HXZ94_07330 [Empedobacter falsenii]|uniref:hypothetical protein n=1 Tax=Empedobacter falsenii TaxID=343874 RepID=UPI0025779023|nr:hypothetical protein [Empedobacter falsenii]MDM1298312.1 hypothetical protein [Empedobacter falsenii]MDM1318131.1 hypothetical protein [Empedobacter falsenii]